MQVPRSFWRGREVAGRGRHDRATVSRDGHWIGLYRWCGRIAQYDPAPSLLSPSSSQTNSGAGNANAKQDAILRVHTDLSQAGHLTRQTLNMLDHALPYDNNPLYAILHEPLYCQGEASDWSAWRVMAEFAEFDVDAALASPSNPDSPEGGDERPLYFTGETVFPHLFTSFAALRAMRNPAEMLARHAEWPRLYDLEQLRERNDVPVYAAVYLDDMYVDYGLSVQTARGIRGCRWFVTSLAKHDGLRRREEEVFGGLWALREEGLD